METAGIQEAAQVVGVIINGMESFLKLTGSFARFTGHELKQLFTFLYAKHKETLADPNKLATGEVALKDLFSRCSKVHEKTGIMQIDERIKEDFELYAKENGLTFSYLYDANKNDGKTEIMYREGQASAFEAFITSRNPMARAYSFDEYLDNATPEAFYEAERQISNAEKNIIAQKTEQAAETVTPEQSITIEQSQVSGMSETGVEIKLLDADNETWYMTLKRDDVRYLDESKDKMIISIGENEHEVYQHSVFGMDDAGKQIIKNDADRGAVYKMTGRDCRAMAKAYPQNADIKQNMDVETPEVFYEAYGVERQTGNGEKETVAPNAEPSAEVESPEQTTVIEKSQISGVSETEVEIKLLDAGNETWYMTLDRDDVRYFDENKEKLIISIGENSEHEIYQHSAFSMDDAGNWTMKKDADRGRVYTVSGRHCRPMAKAYLKKMEIPQKYEITFVNSKTGISKTVDTRAVKDKAKETAKVVKSAVANVRKR